MEILAASINLLSWEELRYAQPAEILSRVGRLHHPDDQRRTLLGRGLLREALRQHGLAGIDLTQVCYTAHGKPFLPGAFHFNLSHAGEWVVLALSDAGPVGIDIEIHQPTDFTDFKHFFSAKHLAEIHQSAQPEAAFYRHWTRYESLLKATGLGLSLDPKDIAWDDDDSATVAGQRWHFCWLQIAVSYSCYLCAAPAFTQLPLVTKLLENTDFHQR